MTDTRSKTKANSIVTLNRHRSSSPTNTIVISDDTDSDTQTLNTTKVDTVAKNSLMSTWKDEMEYRSDFSWNDTEEDSDVLLCTPVKSINTRKNMTTGRFAKKNSINKGTPVIERSIQRSNASQRIKLVTTGKKKSQRYHWSGTFRAKTSPKDVYSNTYYSPRKDKQHEMNNQLTNYNYYCEDFAKKKPASKGDIFYPNKFDLQTIDDSWKKDLWIDGSIGCQPCIDICSDSFEGYDNFKDINQDNDAFSDVNINLSSKKKMDIGDKNKNSCDIDSRANNSIVLYSQLTHDVNNVNKEDGNLCNAKELVNPSINIKSNARKMINDTEEKSAIQLNCYKILYSLLSFLKNVILFSLLPTAYIIFFIYVQEKE